MTNIGNPQNIGGVNAGQGQVQGQPTIGGGAIPQAQTPVQPPQTSPQQAQTSQQQAVDPAPLGVNPVVTPQTQIAPAQATPEVVAPSVSPRAQLQAPTSGILTIELALIQIDLSSAHPSTQSISLPLAGQRHECKHGDTYIVTVDDAIMFSNTMSEFVKYKEDAQFTVSVS